MENMSPGFLWKKSSLKSDPQNEMASTFQKDLESRSGIKLKIKINDNRTTMLSVKWGKEMTQVSLHRMFLQAPNDVIQDLASYLRGKRRRLKPSVRAFIDENWQQLDYSHLLDQEKLSYRGLVYNLKEIYQRINAVYFDNQLDLLIMWFGRHNKRYHSQVTFGLYQDPLKLVKINRILDSSHFPEYVIEYVIYHEMVHHVCPSFVDERGVRHVHSKEFKEREKLYVNYTQAKRWIKDHYEDLFISNQCSSS